MFTHTMHCSYTNTNQNRVNNKDLASGPVVTIHKRFKTRIQYQTYYMQQTRKNKIAGLFGTNPRAAIQ